MNRTGIVNRHITRTHACLTGLGPLVHWYKLDQFVLLEGIGGVLPALKSARNHLCQYMFAGEPALNPEDLLDPCQLLKEMPEGTLPNDEQIANRFRVSVLACPASRIGCCAMA
jgi:hypothetical protein